MTTPEAFIARCRSDVGRLGDDYVWTELADLTDNSELDRWAEWDAAYCVGGMQRARLLEGLPLYPAPLPYYVPSMEQTAKNRGDWIPVTDRANARPGDLVVFDWQLDGTTDHLGVLVAKEGTQDRTVEYNTSPTSAGSQSNGRGCWERLRPTTTTRGYIRHIGGSTMPTAQNVRQYWTTTARIAPSWITTLNTAQVAASYPNTSEARIRCPVEETGRNSVSPSSMPSRMAVRISPMGRGP